MVYLEQPHVNVLSKIDLARQYGQLRFHLDYYTQVQDLSHLLMELNENTFTRRFIGLNKALCDLVEDYGLVSFHPLAVQDKEMMLRLASEIDRANGFVYSSLKDQSIMEQVTQVDGWNDLWVQQVEEKYLGKVPPQ
jgi:hypothetical protein